MDAGLTGPPAALDEQASTAVSQAQSGGRRVCVVGAGTRFLSGISYYTDRLCAALAERHELSVILIRQMLPARLYPGRERVGKPLADLRYGDARTVFDGIDWHSPASVARAIAVLRRERPEVVVFQWWTGTVLHSYLALALAAKRLGARIVVEFHEVQDVGELEYRLAQRYVDLLSPQFFRLLDAAVVHSEHDRAALPERFDLGGRPLVVIPHGPYDQYAAATETERPRDADRPLELLYFGVIRPFKGVEDLIRAFEQIPEPEADRYRLTIVGETWEGWTLPADLVRDSPRAERIRFVNRYVSDEEVGRYFDEADAVVLPYHRSSASGPLQLAMSHGLPVIVTSVGGLTEAAGGYEGASFVPPRDPPAILEAIRGLGTQPARGYASPHSWTETADRFDRLFERISPAPAAPKSAFEPIRMVEVELGEQIADLEAKARPDGAMYRNAIALARLHSVPVGLVDLELPDGRLEAPELCDAVWQPLEEPLRRHLAADGLSAPERLTPAGLPGGPAPCQQGREALLADAPELTVLIPSRERPERLERCIDSILSCEYPSERFSVLVVDNAPETDATRRLVERYAAEGKRVRYAREDATGSASARNAGIALVETELVVMTDDDVIADRFWLAEVAATFAEFPDASCVTGLLLPTDLESEAQLWFEQYGGFTRGFERRVFDLVDNRVDDPLYPWTAGVFGTGNNFSFRTAALREIGGFDPALGNGTPALGGVDSEALLRTVLEGHRIVYEPRALVHHAHRPDYEALKRQVYSYGVGLTAYYLKTLLRRPSLMWDFARRIPTGLRFLLSSESELNESKRADYPRELDGLERRGMVYGPLAYLRSRRRYGPHQIPLPAAAGSLRATPAADPETE